MAADEWCGNLAANGRNEAIPLNLPAPPHPHHFRLGRHFEQLLKAWLETSSRYELLASNLQVMAGKTTTGEFDFLVGCGAETEHWEAAVKFYLGTGDGSDLACWFGPNTQDRFDIKYARLIDHQLRLADTPAAGKLLEKMGLTVTRSRCLMKGRLFHPWDRFAKGDFLLPPGVNPAHEKGWWLSYFDFTRLFNDLGHRYVYLPKSLWLSPLVGEDIHNPLSFYETCELLESSLAEQATHLAIVSEGREVSRGFIVGNAWLERVMAPDPR